MIITEVQYIDVYWSKWLFLQGELLDITCWVASLTFLQVIIWQHNNVVLAIYEAWSMEKGKTKGHLEFSMTFYRASSWLAG